MWRAVLCGVAATFVVAMAASEISVAQQPASTFAEIDLWQRVKESSDPAQLRAYLEKYPNGEFAPIARSRLQSPGGTPKSAPVTVAPVAPPAVQPPPVAPARPAAVPVPVAPAVPAGPSTALVEMTATTTREIQLLLYDRGWRVTKFDGQVTDELKLTITRWQSGSRMQATGALTYGQLASLRATPVPTAWGGVGYTSRGVSVGVSQISTRAAADETLQKDCKKRSGSDCTVTSVWGNRCVAFTYGEGRVGNTNWHTATTGFGDDVEAAKQSSMLECRGLSKTPNTCTSRRVVCADGRGEQPTETRKRRG